jgi:HEAT repeat protein
MAIFKEYSSVLEIECSVDYWSDQAIDEAIQYLERFDNSDWNELVQSVNSKPIGWQARCAETMSEVASEKAIPVLMSLLGSSSEDVLEATIDSLNSFSQSGKIIEFSESERGTLQGFVDRGGLIGTVAKRLLRAGQGLFH